MLTYGSVCSGIEAASVAWHPLGWDAAFFAEIDPFASAVLAERFPGTPNLGDFTAIEGSPRPIDLLVGGTPCQSFSVAGKRLGLDDPRGNLAIEYLRLARRLQPRWLVWENVPGVLSSGGGRDFGAFLGLLGELGYGFAYRVLDAQHFGVPQRRRRVFVVGHLGDWRRAAAVLFEPEGLRGHPAPGREAGPDVAASLTGSLGRRNGQPDNGETRGHLIPSSGAAPRPLTAHPGGSRSDLDTETFIAHTLRADGFDASEDGTGRGTPLVPVPIDMRQASRGATMTNNRREGSSGGAPGTGIGEPGDPAPSLSLSHPPAIAYQCHGTNVGPMGTVRSGNGTHTGGVPFTIQATYAEGTGPHAREALIAKCLDGKGGNPDCDNGGTVVAGPVYYSHDYNQDRVYGTGGPSPAVTANDSNRARNHLVGSAVRRLTPRECERLQGLPDDWTLVTYRGKPAADGPRYRAVGNSMAVPVMAWIGQRIEVVDSIR